MTAYHYVAKKRIMIIRFKALLLMVTLSLFFTSTSDAQISQGGTPFNVGGAIPVPIKTMRGLSLAKVKKEDQAMIETVRFAAPLPLSIDPATEGKWTRLPNGDQLWQFELQVDNALGLFVVFENFNLPAGAKLFGYHPQTKEKLGAYTERNNKPHGEFMLGMITGKILRLEYLVPVASVGPQLKTPFKIKKLYVAYNADYIKPSVSESRTSSDFEDAMDCNININCSQGNAWQDHKRGVVRMLRVFEEGIGWCTGSLVNNTNQDGTPYVLSAHHCIAGFTPLLNLWRFDFNYEFSGCNDESVEPVTYSMQGCQYRSGREQTDFLLLELTDVIPQSYNVYFQGWDRSDTAIPNSMTGIHHPRGDVKKISTSDQPITVFNNSIIWPTPSGTVITPPNHHFRVVLSEGTVEDGSSGSAFFNENGLIVGQLHGGNLGCNSNNVTYYGRFSLSWEDGNTPDTRLRDWLDPANTGQTSIGKYEYSAATLSGNVSMPNGTGVQYVKVAATGPSIVDTVETDANGNYSFSNIRNNESVLLNFSRTGRSLNGVSITDYIAVRKDILSIESLTPDQVLAADMNDNGSVTIGDYVELLQVFLVIEPEFELGSWRFFENNIPLSINGNIVRDVKVVKRGDINFNANPTE